MEAATQNPPGKARAGSYLLAILLPIVGVIIAIVQFSRGHVGPGLAVLLTSTVAFFVWFTILVSMAATDAANDYNGYSDCINNAQTLRQMNDC